MRVKSQVSHPHIIDLSPRSLNVCIVRCFQPGKGGEGIINMESCEGELGVRGCERLEVKCLWGFRKGCKPGEGV